MFAFEEFIRIGAVGYDDENTNFVRSSSSQMTFLQILETLPFIAGKDYFNLINESATGGWVRMCNLYIVLVY